MSIKTFLFSVFLLGTLSPSTYGAPAIDVRADLKLRQMGEYLKSAQEFTFKADIIYDTVMKEVVWLGEGENGGRGDKGTR